MLKFHDGYIGEADNNSKHQWRDGLDSQDNFEKNILNFPKLKYFENIKYEFNNLGHRCKDISEINLENYLLFIGCSFTEGTGNYLEDTYPYIVSKRLKIDYYNLGIRGSGYDVQLHNLFRWFVENKPPTLLVWQWTIPPRMAISTVDGIYPNGPWTVDKKYLEFLALSDEIKYPELHRQMITEILSRLSIPVIQVDVNLTPNTIHFTRIDKGRDRIHPGPKSNEHLSDNIVGYYNKYIKNNYASQ